MLDLADKQYRKERLHLLGGAIVAMLPDDKFITGQRYISLLLGQLQAGGPDESWKINQTGCEFNAACLCRYQGDRVPARYGTQGQSPDKTDGKAVCSRSRLIGTSVPCFSMLTPDVRCERGPRDSISLSKKVSTVQ